MNRPRLAITMGDAAGVGPEIVMKALAHPDVYARCRPFVVGDVARLAQAAKLAGVSSGLRRVAGPEEARFDAGTVDCLDLGLIPAGLAFGQVSAAAGHAAHEYVRVATGLAMAGRIEALVTAPLNKEALRAGGHDFPGHTELLAALTGTPEVSMMLTGPGLRVILVTSHMGLIAAIGAIEPGLVMRTIARGRDVLIKAGIARARIAVCGINPHAGENGLFGEGEEEQKVAPAIAAARAKGWDVEGPLPADTLFYRARRGDFDMVVAMYHDQGLAPVKVLGLESGVNITVGLPVIRTSVDHGTAFDIAGTGRADARSLLQAIDAAIALSPRQA
jgi:4-phospho-D-threonate 3-dehydrogenase / 4-phospho-D-erythronate 3-dehydrogenase